MNKGYEHGAVKEICGCVDQLGDFLTTQDHAQLASPLGSRIVVEQVVSLQCPDVEEAQRGYNLGTVPASNFLSWNR